MALKSFEQSGLQQNENLKEAYTLAKGVVEAVGPALEEYFNAVISGAQLAQSLPDAAENDKLRWCISMFTDTAIEFSGSKRSEVEAKVNAIDAGAHITVSTGEANLDDPKFDLSTAPADTKVEAAIGMVASFPFAERVSDAQEIKSFQERFNRHSQAIKKGEIPDSLYQKMSDTVKKVNALGPK
jgi:hypothetical protein